MGTDILRGCVGAPAISADRMVCGAFIVRVPLSALPAFLHFSAILFEAHEALAVVALQCGVLRFVGCNVVYLVNDGQTPS
jgi:hypothetical protein